MTPAETVSTDHSFYQRVPFPRRAPFRWPNRAPVAFAVLVSAEYYEMQPPDNAFIPPNVPGGFGRGPYPDFRVYTARAYGNRVGIFRLFEALRRHGLPATVAVDMLTAQHCPAVIREAVRAGYEVAGHGQAVTRVISANMSEAEERDYIKTSLGTLEAACGTRPGRLARYQIRRVGRAGAARRAWRAIRDGLAQRRAALQHDDCGRADPLGPVAIDCDDVFSHFNRRITMRRWVQCVIEALDRLIADGRNSGRVLVLNVHPWLMGHPWRVTYFEELLRAVAARNDIWATTTGAIAAWWSDQDATYPWVVSADDRA